MVDLGGRIRYMSSPIEAILGWTAAEMVGRPSSDFVHPDDLELCRQVWEAVIATPGATARVDIRHRTRDGGIRLIEGHFSNRLDDPLVRGVVINERDVTERRAIEEQLRRRAARDEAVNRLGRQALESIEPALLAGQATRMVRPLMAATAVTFVRVLADRRSYVFERWNGEVDVPAHPLSLDDDHQVEAEAVRTNRVASAPGALSMPVPGRDGPYGALTVHRPVQHPFTDDDITFLQAVAGVVSLAVQRRGAEEEIRSQALHDALTGLPNRALFLDRLDRALGRAAPRSTRVGVVFVDLDRFKDLNDGYGHAMGDQVLHEVARRIVSSLRPGDTVARLGGDEFTLLVEDLDRSAELDRLVARVSTAISRPMTIDGIHLHVSASLGVREATGAEAPEVLIGDADAAMYVAKQKGRARTERFVPAMRSRVHERLQVGEDLARAMAGGELHMAYQPVVDLRTGQTTGLEALLRWDDPTRGPIPPTAFIGLAEESGHIHELGRWVLEHTLEEVRAWGGRDPGLTVAINISPAQLVDPELPDVVATLLRRTGLRPACVGLEVTERAFELDLGTMACALQALRDLGVATAIDDFGTGYSSIAYLRELPVDVLKLDATFVASLSTSREDRAIAEAVAAFGRTLGMATVAEGVETEDQARAVRALGYTRAQGFLYGKPVPLRDVALRSSDALQAC